jgi:hypothetical protein
MPREFKRALESGTLTRGEANRHKLGDTSVQTTAYLIRPDTDGDGDGEGEAMARGRRRRQGRRLRRRRRRGRRRRARRPPWDRKGNAYLHRSAEVECSIENETTTKKREAQTGRQTKPNRPMCATETLTSANLKAGSNGGKNRLRHKIFSVTWDIANPYKYIGFVRFLRESLSTSMLLY